MRSLTVAFRRCRRATGTPSLLVAFLTLCAIGALLQRRERLRREAARPIDVVELGDPHSACIMPAFSGDADGAAADSNLHLGKPLTEEEITIAKAEYRNSRRSYCSRDVEPWVTLTDGAVHIARPNARCVARPLHRLDDENTTYGAEELLTNGQPLQQSIIDVACDDTSGGESWTALLRGVPEQIPLLSKHAAVEWSKDDDKDGSRRVDDAKSTTHTNLSVILLGHDSVSAPLWRRWFPLTHRYFVHNLGAMQVNSANVVGDGTTAHMLAMLTGKYEAELPETRRGYPGKWLGFYRIC